MVVVVVVVVVVAAAAAVVSRVEVVVVLLFVLCIFGTPSKKVTSTEARGHYTIGKEIVDLVLDRCLAE